VKEDLVLDKSGRAVPGGLEQPAAEPSAHRQKETLYRPLLIIFRNQQYLRRVLKGGSRGGQSLNNYLLDFLLIVPNNTSY
jgi:hypothetical protein